MRRIEQALVMVLWALLAISPSGCGDEERPDDETDDTDDADGGADAGPDSDWDWGSSGVFGHLLGGFVPGGFDVRWVGCGFSAGSYTGNTTSEQDGYYELELPPGLHNGSAEWGSVSDTSCEGRVSQVLVSDGLWVEINIDIECTWWD